jgi:hypothetical protein
MDTGRVVERKRAVQVGMDKECFVWFGTGRKGLR